jgi:hypothetical protein
MKRIVSIIVIFVLCISILGCANTKVIDGIEYDKWGLLNFWEKRNPNIEYKIVWGNVFWGIVLSELFFIPTIYFFGFALFQPVRKAPEIKEQIGVKK